MTWEMEDLNMKTNKIMHPEYPNTLHKGLVYKPFFYVKRPHCDHGIYDFPPKNSKKKKKKAKKPSKGAKKDKKMLLLAQTSSHSISQMTNKMQSLKGKEEEEEEGKEEGEDKKDDKRQAWIPVITKTSKKYHPPTIPSPDYSMWDPVKHKVVPVKVRREFHKPKKHAQKKLDKAQERAKKTDRKDAGYKIKPVHEKKTLAKPSKTFRRVWPPFKFDEGFIPGDAMVAWDSIKESEKVLNIPTMKSPHKDFRWMVFFYVRCLYKISKGATPLLPVFVLAHKDFKWTKGKLPSYIPVPRNLVPYKGSLQIQDLEVKFIQKMAHESIGEKKLILPPRGVDPKKAYKLAKKYRTILVHLKRQLNPKYARNVSKKFGLIEGNRKELDRERDEEMTGMFIRKDHAMRKKLKKKHEALKKKEKKRKEVIKKKIKKKKQRAENGGVHHKQLLKMKRVCVKRKLEIRLNTYNMPVEQRRFKAICVKYMWKPVYTMSQWKQHQQYMRKMQQREQLVHYCLNNLHVVLNTRGLSNLEPSMSEKCREFYLGLKKDRTNHMMDQVTPVLDQIGGTLQIKSNLMKLNPNLINTQQINKQLGGPKANKGLVPKNEEQGEQGDEAHHKGDGKAKKEKSKRV